MVTAPCTIAVLCSVLTRQKDPLYSHISDPWAPNTRLLVMIGLISKCSIHLAIVIWPLSKLLRSLHLAISPTSSMLTTRADYWLTIHLDLDEHNWYKLINQSIKRINVLHFRTFGLLCVCISPRAKATPCYNTEEYQK